MRIFLIYFSGFLLVYSVACSIVISGFVDFEKRVYSARNGIPQTIGGKEITCSPTPKQIELDRLEEQIQTLKGK